MTTIEKLKKQIDDVIVEYSKLIGKRDEGIAALRAENEARKVEIVNLHKSYIERFTKPRTESQEIAGLRAALAESLRIGEKQALEWDRFWEAMGVRSKDISVDQAIEKYQSIVTENAELRKQLDEWEDYFGCELD